MIVVDTSALIAIIKREPMARVLAEALLSADSVVISAGTVVEARVVATRGGRIADLDEVLKAIISEIIPVTGERARLISDAYRSWGKGFHAAALNFGDCFSYATAKELGCPLLFVGHDFQQTDVRPAMQASYP
ncbi:MAG: type II toxin-antitoxin system VapC family toxin [Neorhizobium sp.]|jgi:ribonuclease VapC|nr:type II toxin-antitoxin system VapC family toxin [Neorhizobium sp.]